MSDDSIPDIKPSVSRSSSELIAGQARRVLGMLQDDDRLLVEAYIADVTKALAATQVKWASAMTAITIIGVAVVLCTAVGATVFAINSSLAEPRARCEGWCAHETKNGTWTVGDARFQIPDRCDCATPVDPTRVWHPPQQ